MSRYRRFRQTLQQPAYRIRLAFFLILGFTAVLLSVLIQSRSPFWSEVLLEFAVTFGAVGVLQLLWDFLGGEPMELRIEEVKDEVRSVQQSITLLSDLIDGNIGIERIWSDRQAWREDPADGLRVWFARVCQANRVDIMSNTLWNNWMHRVEFRSRLFDNVAQGAHVRILIYGPDSEAVRLRAKDERDVPGQMQMEIKSTLLTVAEERSNLPVPAKANLEVRLTTQTLHPVQMIRANDRMVVASYLSGKSGSPSPTMQIRGDKSSYFQKYAEQFGTLWEQAEPFGDDQFNIVLQEYRYLPAPPTED